MQDEGRNRQPGRERTGAEAMRVAEALRAEIVAGTLAASAPLRQELLAERFATSRMPVRDALRILEQEGFVDIVPNRGARVAAIEPADYREICEMRAALEGLAIRLAIPELSNSRIDQAAAIQAEAEGAGIARFGALNAAFHAALYNVCGRPRLLSTIAGLHDLADRYMRIAAIKLDYVDRSHAEHRAILAACRSRDADRAEHLVRAHIMDAGVQLAEQLAARL